VTERFESAEAHAYVDECLSREDRIAFETRLRDDPELRRRVDLWRAQNEAIRAAFRAPPRSRGPLSVGRPTNENVSAPLAVDSRRVRTGETASDPAAHPARTSEPRRTFPQPAPVRRKRATLLRTALILSLSLFLVALSAAGGPVDERGPLTDAALAAFRAFGAESSVALDITSSDARALAKQLSPRFVADPATADFDITGWKLLGARFVPGTASAAAFVLWEKSNRTRMGLLIEPLDAPMDSTPRNRDFGGVAISAWTAGGQGFAAVGPDMKAVGVLTRMGLNFLAAPLSY
jgi:anti-sigma factor RsiW